MKSYLLIYNSEKGFLQALRLLKERPLLKVEALSPYDIPEETPFSGSERALNSVKAATLGGGVLGLITGYGMTWYASVINAPLLVGARPLNSWPAFIPLIFVLGVLFAGVSGFIAFLIRLRFPMPYHPIFKSPSYNLAAERFYILSREAFPTPLLESLAADAIEEIPQ
ncbi:MAG: DUF3341 domain-containing protein [Pseudobdellovibrionaceae bacterium]